MLADTPVSPATLKWILTELERLRAKERPRDFVPRLYLSPWDFTSTAANITVNGNWLGRSFPDAATTLAHVSFPLPAGWEGQTATIRLWWSPGSTNTGNVLWQNIFQKFIAGTTVNLAADVASSVLSAGSGVVDRPVLATNTLSLTGFTAGQAFQYRLARIGTDGTDTFTSTAALLAVEISVVG